MARLLALLENKRRRQTMEAAVGRAETKKSGGLQERRGKHHSVPSACCANRRVGVRSQLNPPPL